MVDAAASRAATSKPASRSNRRRSSALRPRPSARARTDESRGVFNRSLSRLRIVRTLTPARSANSSWVSCACHRNPRNIAPNVWLPLTAAPDSCRPPQPRRPAMARIKCKCVAGPRPSPQLQVDGPAGVTPAQMRRRPQLPWLAAGPRPGGAPSTVDPPVEMRGRDRPRLRPARDQRGTESRDVGVSRCWPEQTTDVRPPKRPISCGQRPRSAGVRLTPVVGLLTAGLRPALGRLLGHGREATQSRISPRWDGITAPDNFSRPYTGHSAGKSWSGPPSAPGRTRTHDPLLRRQPLYPSELRGPAQAQRYCRSLPTSPLRYRLAGSPGWSDRLSLPLVAVAQVVRASGCGPEGRGFESPRSPQVRAFRL